MNPVLDLSENHRRTISITLQLVDEALSEWSDWCHGKVRSGVMYRQVDTLSETQKVELRHNIETIRQTIIRLRDDLDLEPKNDSTAHSIAGHASLLWEMLTELNSRGLQGYGKVSEELGHYLDPIGEKLTEQMSAISGLLSQPKGTTIVL
jgi:hypothetical protein